MQKSLHRNPSKNPLVEKDETYNKEFMNEHFRIVIMARGKAHCENNKKYGSFLSALAALREYSRTVKGKKLVYKCDHCGLYHFTNLPDAEEINGYNNQPFTDNYQENSSLFSACEGKRGFNTRLMAQTFINLNLVNTVTPYPCPFCGRWHIGTKKNEDWL